VDFMKFLQLNDGPAIAGRITFSNSHANLFTVVSVCFWPVWYFGGHPRRRLTRFSPCHGMPARMPGRACSGQRDALHESSRRWHLRPRAVCGVANARNGYGHCCALRLAAYPDPQCQLAARCGQSTPRITGHKE
ncbi:MAG TPA: hypothetical protein PLR92_07400, partial [Alicycliphilus denitrificans]|nr:hypothetical protein [Alicycliphilus denitrificans]